MHLSYSSFVHAALSPRSLMASSDINNNVLTEHSYLLRGKTPMRKFCSPIGKCENRNDVTYASSTTSLTDADLRIK